MSRRSTIVPDHIRHHLLQVVNVSGAQLGGHPLPKCSYIFLELAHVPWLVLLPQVILHRSPHFLNGIPVRTLSRALPPSAAVAGKNKLECTDLYVLDHCPGTVCSHQGRLCEQMG